MISLMKDANVWDDNLKQIVAEVYKDCVMCKVYKKTLPRPIVALPMLPMLPMLGPTPTTEIWDDVSLAAEL